MVEWPFRNSVTVPASWQYLAGLGRGSPEVKVTYALKQCPTHGAASPIARIHRSMNQGAEMGTAQYCFSDPLATFLLPVPVTLSLA